MKGLLIKDFKLLKGQKQFFAAVLIVMTVFLMTSTSLSFVISYITVMMGMLTLTTIGYDEHENGMGYLFTLPVSRKGYVREKYLFGIMTTLPVLAVVSAIAFLVSGIRHIDFSVEEWGGAIMGSMLIVTMMLSLLIPIELKFGAERSRIAMTLVFGGAFAVVFIGVKAGEFLGIDWKIWLDRLNGLDLPVVWGAFAVICGGALAISYLFSLRFLMRREF
ncbi:MAG: ABC-2 transporter permease [Dorea sp.]|jgi:ABC-2 type transport system permease protein|nr:ABC-2 transporter permease [Dorea sp.]